MRERSYCDGNIELHSLYINVSINNQQEEN